MFESLKRLLRVATRRVESTPGYFILPYRGYGSSKEIFLMGGVFHQPASRRDGSDRLLAQVARRLLRRGVSDVDVEVRFHGSTAHVTTDNHGYFQAHLQLDARPPGDGLWHDVEIVLVDPPEDASPEHVSATGEIFIPPAGARYVVISDIDDTVMYTGVANKIKMFWRLFAQDAESRVAFPGVASLYRAFYGGPTGPDLNPILYVSRGHWGLYEMLVEFFHAHDIPVGPILFLRDWGVSLKNPIPQRAEEHKADLIRRMLALYDDYPFVLIGDSGQHDAEIYADVVHEHPGRVEAVYIRDVSGSSSRAGEIEKLVAEVEEAGSSLVLADDTYAMARHAAEHGLISESALADVLEERVREADPKPEDRKGPVVVEP